LRPLLVCQTAEPVKARIERGQGDADIRADASSTRDLEVVKLLVSLGIRHHVRKPPRQQPVTVRVLDRRRGAGAR
jgi:hypothetical protein